VHTTASAASRVTDTSPRSANNVRQSAIARRASLILEVRCAAAGTVKD
jgi:hypothetical protein